ncbi:unnamed protein product [Polarella glacialis]|uniref:Uncharacterized protein n=1 Tax=Polarella glacialis TaxID=89957 RepID=A0A813LZU9_POLGL|nr:unnamed protein product [Polarella glacialis]
MYKNKVPRENAKVSFRTRQWCPVCEHSVAFKSKHKPHGLECKDNMLKPRDKALEIMFEQFEMRAVECQVAYLTMIVWPSVIWSLLQALILLRFCPGCKQECFEEESHIFAKCPALTELTAKYRESFDGTDSDFEYQLRHFDILQGGPATTQMVIHVANVVDFWSKLLKQDIQVKELVCFEAVHKWWRGSRKNNSKMSSLSVPWQGTSKQHQEPGQEYTGSDIWNSVYRFSDDPLYTPLFDPAAQLRQMYDRGEFTDTASQHPLVFKGPPWHHPGRMTIYSKETPVDKNQERQGQHQIVPPWRASVPSPAPSALRGSSRRASAPSSGSGGAKPASGAGTSSGSQASVHRSGIARTARVSSVSLVPRAGRLVAGPPQGARQMPRPPSRDLLPRALGFRMLPVAPLPSHSPRLSCSRSPRRAAPSDFWANRAKPKARHQDLSSFTNLNGSAVAAPER